MGIDEEPTRDRKRPRHDLRAGREPTARAMDLEHRLLDDILGPRAIARVAHEERHETWRETVVDLGKRRVFAPCVSVHRRIEVARHRAPHNMREIPRGLLDDRNHCEGVRWRRALVSSEGWGACAPPLMF